jgi:hypothetical protein
MAKQPKTALEKIVKVVNELSFMFWLICTVFTVQFFFGSSEPLTSKEVVEIEAFCNDNNLGTSVNWDLWTQKTVGVACTGVKPDAKPAKKTN